MPDANHFSGEIVVASRIVDYLSSGLYESPASCLKELVNNSYDADATQVAMFVKPDADRIIIEDDGHGMTRSEFVRHFSRISESHKREGSDTTPSGRPKVGKIGIGFIAANEICDVMEIYSTKRGSNELLHANIYFHKMREDPEARRRDGESFAKGDYEGEVLSTESESHYTQIFLKQVRGEARSILAGAAQAAHTAGDRSLYGLAAPSVKQVLSDPNLRSWSEFDSYSQNYLSIGLNVPVAYYDGWLPPKLVERVRDFEEHAKSLNFSLLIDGSEVLKPTVFAPENKKTLISRFDLAGKHVSAKGYFYAQHGAIRPQNLQGLLIRIRNAAIGDYDQTFLSFSPSEGPLFQSWISAEVWADDQLEDAMNIDRRTIRVAHPAFVELQQAIHRHLSALIKEVRGTLYGEGSKTRRQEKARVAADSIVRVADQSLAVVGPRAAAELKSSWAEEAKGTSGASKLLKKYTVADLYKVVIEVAEEVLTPEQVRKFVRRLTARLQR